jgi:hypothetical protein
MISIAGPRARPIIIAGWGALCGGPAMLHPIEPGPRIPRVPIVIQGADSPGGAYDYGRHRISRLDHRRHPRALLPRQVLSPGSNPNRIVPFLSISNGAGFRGGHHVVEASGHHRCHCCGGLHVNRRAGSGSFRARRPTRLLSLLPPHPPSQRDPAAARRPSVKDFHGRDQTVGSFPAVPS